MRVVYMGTPSFAVPCMEALRASHEVVAVYTRPDRPAGRGRTLKSSAVKVAASASGPRVLQPDSLRDPAAVAEFASLRADVCVVAAYGAILPPSVLVATRLGCVNVHASLLPRWRGAAPVQRAILAGDEVTGVSIMLMEEGLDTGPYAEQVCVPADALGAAALTEALADAAPPALLRVLERMDHGTVTWIEQDETLATYAGKVGAADVALSPEIPAIDASRRVRASSRSAPARCAIAGVCVTVSAVAPSPVALAPGDVIASKHELLIGFADAALAISLLTPQGRSEMDGASFARGLRAEGEPTWGACT
jgi:methionyl-tRNA formyltransferase